MEIGKLLREARKRRGFTAEQVAEALDFATPTITRWENGSIDISSSTLVRYCEVIGITLAELFGNDQARLPFKGITKKDVLAYLRSQKGLSVPRQDTDTCKRLVENHVESVTVWTKEDTHIKLKYQLIAGMSEAGGGGGTPAQTYCLVLDAFLH